MLGWLRTLARAMEQPWIMAGWLSCARMKLFGAMDAARLARPVPRILPCAAAPALEQRNRTKCPTPATGTGLVLSSDTDVSVIFGQKVKPRTGKWASPRGHRSLPSPLLGAASPKKPKCSSSEHVMRD